MRNRSVVVETSRLGEDFSSKAPEQSDVIVNNEM